jgi:hypothetical protein
MISAEETILRLAVAAVLGGLVFEVDAAGTLTLRLSLGLDGEPLHPELSPR